MQVAGASTANTPVLSAQGSDTNISVAVIGKGTGGVDLAPGANGVNISNGNTVTGTTRTAFGSGYSGVPTATFSLPNIPYGTQAVATVLMSYNSIPTITNGGTGYTVGDVLTVVGGTPSGVAATMTVDRKSVV